MSTYKKAFSPLRVGDIELKNRLVMSPMGDGLANREGNVTEEMVAYYGARARGGIGLIIVGSTCVCEDDGNKPDQHKIFREQNLRGLRRLSEGVHRYDAKIFVQLIHAGRQANPAVLGHGTVGASPLPVITGEVPGIPRELTIPEIHEIEQSFARAAELATRAGLDGVEVHAGHGYLIHGFLSPVQNIRTDEYGGSLENRTRMLRNVLTGIREKVGPTFPISVRLSAVDLLPGGLEIEDSIEIAKIAEQCGASMLNVTAGMIETMYIQSAGPEREQGYLVPWAEQIKAAVKIPVAAAGRFRDMEVAEQVLEDGRLDLVSFGRPMIADPNMVRKVMDDREDEIRRCLSCGYCHDTNKIGGPRCAMNPTMGLELWYDEVDKNGNGRSVVVVGGGPAGCEASRILAKRGFKVTLFERSDHLGGQTLLAAVPPTKDDILNCQRYYAAVLPKLGVEIKFNTEATMGLIQAADPWAVFLAAGSRPLHVPLPGADGEQVTTAQALLGGEYKEITDSKVLIAGIGDTGIDVASWLAERNNQIIMADMAFKPQDKLLRTRKKKFKALVEHGVSVYDGHKLLRIAPDKVSFQRISDGELVDFEAEYVVMSLGVRPNKELWEDLKARYGHRAFLVGDVAKTGMIHDAIFAGFNAAWNLDAFNDEL